MKPATRRSQLWIRLVLGIALVAWLVLASTLRPGAFRPLAAGTDAASFLQRQGQPGGDNQAAAALEFYRLKRLPAGETALGADRYLAARAQLCRWLPAQAREGAGQGWISLGPDNIGQPQPLVPTAPCATSDWRPPDFNFGATLFSHGVPYPAGTTYLGGAADHGLLRGTDAGGRQAWERLLGGVGGSVAVDPTNTQTIYLSQAGLALKKSTDGGQSFRAASNGINDAGLFVTPLVLDPNEAQRLWVGGRALWRTTDGAAHWTQASAAVADHGQISAIAVAAANPNLVLAGTSQGYIQRTQFGLSRTASDVWPSVRPRDGFVSSLTFDPRTPNLAYATYSTFGGPHVWRSMDAGVTWAALDGASLPDIPVHQLVIDPYNRARLYLGTDLGVFVSLDGGESWAVEPTGFGLAVTEALAVNQPGDGQADAGANLFAFTHGQGVWRVPLNLQGNCSYTVTPSVQVFEAAGGPGSASVTTTSNCAWMAGSSVPWITITAGGSGSGNGMVSYTVAANTTNETRSARLTIAGRELNVLQAGQGGSCATTPIATAQVVNGTLNTNDCPLGLEPTLIYYSDRYSFTATAGSRVSIVLTSTDYEPRLFLVGPDGRTVAQASTNSTSRDSVRIPTSGFLTLAASGLYTLEATSGFARRTGNYQLSLNLVPQECGSYSVTPVRQSFEAEGGAGSLQVAASSGCSWTASSFVSWVTLTAGGTGGGSANVAFAVAPNTSRIFRSGMLEIAGQAVTIEQAGMGGSCGHMPLAVGQTVSADLSNADCRSRRSSSFDTYYADRYSFNASAGQPVLLLASSTEFVPYLYLTDISGVVLAEGGLRLPQGSGFFNVPATGTYFVELTSTTTTTATVARNYLLTLFSPPPGCGYAITPTSRSFEAVGGQMEISVTAGAACRWAAVSDVPWLTLDSASGTGNGSASFTVRPNTSNELRRGTVVIAGEVFNLEQAGAGGSCAVLPLMPGQTLSGDLSRADCRARLRTDSGTYFADRYSFMGRAGEQVSLTVEGDFFPVVTLADAAGQVLGQGRRVPANGFLALPLDGAYLVEVTANSGLSITGSYRLSFNLIPAGCSYRVTPDGQRFEAGGGSGSVDVQASAGCAWTASVGASEANWITINAGATGSGNGKVEFTVAANPENRFRTAKLSIAGQLFTVEQAGTSGNCAPRPVAPGQIIAAQISAGDCPGFEDVNDRVYPTDRYSFSADAGEQLIITAVVTPPASSSAGLTIQLLAPNGDSLATARTRLPSSGGFFTLPASGTYTIEVTAFFTPSGASVFPYTLELRLVPAGCSYMLVPTSQSFEAAGGQGTLSVVTGANCPWTARADASWVTLTAGASGAGGGTVEFSVAANPTNQARRATLNIGERLFNVEQAGAGGSCAVTPITAGQPVNGTLSRADCPTGASGGTTSLIDRYSFTANAGDQIAVVVESNLFPTITLRDAQGNRLAEEFSAARLPRSGFYQILSSGTYLIDLVGREGPYRLTLEVTPGGCGYAFAPPLQSFAPTGGSGEVLIFAARGCAWTARTSANWLTLGTPSGTGDGRVTFSVAANTSTSRRTATIVVSDKSFTVEQGGVGSHCAPAPISLGQTVNGSLNSADCRSLRPSDRDFYLADRYALDFTAGQQFALVATAAGFTPTLTVLNPDGVVILQGATRLPTDEGFLTLPTSGTYSIEISSSFVSGSGNYSLLLAQPSACAISLTPASFSFERAFERGGGQGSVNVVAATGCAWTALSEADWLTITAGTSGSGNGALSFTVAPNTSNNVRRGVLKVADQSLLIEQAGASGSCAVLPLVKGQRVSGSLTRGDCAARFGFTPGSSATLHPYADRYSFTAEAGELIDIVPNEATFVLIAPNGVPVNPVFNVFPQPVRWPVLLPLSGVYTLEVSGSVRDYAFTVVSMPGSCAYAVAPPSRAVFEAAGGTFNVNVLAGAGCAWTAASSVSWIRVDAEAGGNGNGMVSFTVEANGGDQRSGNITVAGRSFTIAQAGAGGSCEPLPIQPNQSVSGTLARADCPARTGGGLDRFTFSGLAGEQVAVTVFGPTSQMTLDLLGPDGRNVAGQSFRARLPESGFITLPMSGSYTIELGATVGFTLSYTLNLSVLPAGCSFRLSPAQAAFESAGGTGNVSLAASAGCDWTVINRASWITLTAGASGSGNGQIEFTVAPNISIASRRTTLVIGGQPFLVQQAGLGGTCVVAPLVAGQSVLGTIDEADCLLPGSDRFYADTYSFSGQAGAQLIVTLVGLPRNTLTLISPDGRQASITSNVPFTLPADGVYLLSVALDSGVTGLGTDYLLSLSLAPASCSYRITPARQSFEAEGGTGNLNVASSAGCPWLAVANAGWITLRMGSSGSGQGTVAYSVAANTGSNSRRGQITLAGQTFTVEQAGAGGTCAAVPVTPGQMVTGRLSGADCLSAVSGSSADRYSFNARAGDQVAITTSLFSSIVTLLDPNGQVLARSDGFGTRLPVGEGFVKLPASGLYLIEFSSRSSGGQDYTFTLLLAPAGCGYTLAPTFQEFDANGGSGSLQVLAGQGCAWMAESNVPWVRLNPSSGSGQATVSYIVSANNTGNFRSGTLLIAGRSFSVEQAGAGGSCIAIPITSGVSLNGSWSNADCRSRLRSGGGSSFYTDRYSFAGRAGERVTLSLTTNASATPSLTLLDPQGAVRLQLPGLRLPAGSGVYLLPLDGRYLIEVTSTSLANYSLTLSLQPACSFAVAPTSLLIESNGGAGSVMVTSASGCDWLALSNANWVNFGPGSSFGSGNQLVNFTVAANPEATPRRTTLSIAGQMVTLTQAGKLTTVSAANYSGTELAPESIVAAFGAGLATATQTAAVPVTRLAGTSVRVRDSAETTREALIFFVSPGQVNYLVPAGTATGPATITITSGDGTVSTGTAQLVATAPGLFAANANGRGVAAAVVMRVRADGTQSFEPVAVFDAEQNRFVAVPIDLGPASDQVYLVLFGTGLRGRSALEAVTATVGNLAAPVQFAGPQGGFAGLDQVNLHLPRALAGRGEVEVALRVDNRAANLVQVSIK